MNALNFETGLVTYSINGTCEVAFNPTDSYFVERPFNAFDSLDKKQDAYRTEVERTANKREIFDLARARDEEMRGIIDDLFGQPVCAEVFGGMNVYAIASGLPVWCNFMLAVIDEIDVS